MSHISVLLHETVDALVADRNTGIFIDGTFGRGGHTRLLLSKLDENARVYGFDKDPQALETAAILEQEDPRFKIIHASFADLKHELEVRGIGLVDGVMADLGVSSPQLDLAERGFSFQKDGPLDMRMNPKQEKDASQIVNRASKKELLRILTEFGEEKRGFAERIVDQIIYTRKKTPITTTKQLADLILSVHKGRWQKTHPATRTFQAIRIAVNEELQQVEEMLKLVSKLLNSGGRVGIITFHSLEDKIVKDFFKKDSENLLESKFENLTKKPLDGAKEDANNPRARSAKLRVSIRK